MKKMLAILLCSLLAFISVSYAEDISSLPTVELQQRLESIKEELITRQIEEGRRPLVTEEMGVKILFDGFSKDGEHIRFIILNNSTETLPVAVCVEELYIENWDVLDNGIMQTLRQGKNGVGEALIKWENCITADEKTASKIDVRFSFYIDEGYEWEEIYETDLITFYIK